MTTHGENAPPLLEILEPRRLLSGDGLLGQYYPTADLTGTPIGQHDAAVQFDWGRGSPHNALPADAFSARWTGRVEAVYSQSYTFTVQANGGVRLWVNNQQLINQWNAAGPQTFSGNISLTAGQKYDLRLEYRETAGDAGVSLRWSSASQPLQIIPQARLYSMLSGNVGSATGGFDYDGATGRYTVRGSGNALAETSDVAHLAYQTLTGDGEIVARLVSKSSANAVAGLMIRGSLTGSSSGAGIYSHGTSGLLSVVRKQSSANIEGSWLGGQPTSNIWLKLVRKGSTLTGYYSTDGQTWLGAWGKNITIGQTIYVGLAVSGNSGSTQATAVFDNVRLSTPQWGYDTSWIGNSFNGAGQWVQNDIKGFYVASDGTIFTNSPWDEASHEAGIYRNAQSIGGAGDLHGWGRGGGWAVVADSNYIYLTMGQAYLTWDAEGYPSAGEYWHAVRRYSRATMRPAPFTGGSGYDDSMLVVKTNGSQLSGIWVSGNELFVSDEENNRVLVYNKSSMSLLRTLSVTRPGQISEDGSGNLWIISKSNASNPAKILKYTKAGVKLSPEITDVVKPTSIAYHPVTGQLLVAEDGPRQQILFYNIQSQPTLAGTLGEVGGMSSGIPGRVTPTKFDNPSGVGVDSAGNIYVGFQGMNVEFSHIGLGAVIRSFSPTKQLNWEIHGLQFVDSAVVDPASDGVEIFTKDERFVMDYSKSNGQEYTWVGRTAVEGINIDDTRLSGGGSSVLMQRVNGQKLLYVTGQGGMNLDIYRFVEGSEVAIHTAAIVEAPGTWAGRTQTFIWRDLNGDGIRQTSEDQLLSLGIREDGFGFSVDQNGTVWGTGYYTGIRKYSFTGFHANGAPLFSNSVQTYGASPFNILGRAVYDAPTDTMYVTGYTPQRPRTVGDWGVAGSEMIRFNNWSGSRTIAWRIPLPYDPDPEIGDPILAKSIAVAGNRVFVGMVASGTILAYDTRTGTRVMEMPRGPEIGGYGGWLDTVLPISAYRRANGEYLVFVEDDLLAKITMMRTGAITPTDLTATANTSGGVELRWNDNCNRESGFVVEQSIDGVNFTPIATLTTNTTSYTVASVTPGLSTRFRVRATHAFDDSPYSNTATVNLQSIPAPWQHTEIGSVGIAGGAGEHQGAWTVSASGTDIWDTADQFGFVHRTFSGDFEVIARVNSLTRTDDWAKAGVMVRESLNANARHASMFITGVSGTAFQYRPATGGQSEHIAGTQSAAPVWVRLARIGNQFQAYESADGNTWRPVGSTAIAMSSTVYVGLAVTSHTNSAINTATFDSLTVRALDTIAPTLVGSPVINAGTSAPNSRSQIRTVSWHFSEAVIAGMANLLLRNRDTGATISLSSRTLVLSGSTITLTLDRPGIDPAAQLFLQNGNYELILGPGVTDLAGNPLDANGDGTPGESVSLRFYKLTGDFNGDRRVTSTDYLLWKQSYGLTVSGLVDAAYDLNGDGRVTSTDYLLWRDRLGGSVSSATDGMSLI